MGYGVSGNAYGTGDLFGGWNYAVIPARKTQTAEELVRVGAKVFNLSKVVSVNLGVRDGDNHVVITFDGGSRWTVYGADADAVRRFFAANALTIVPDETGSDEDSGSPDGECSCTDCRSCTTPGPLADDFDLRLGDDEESDDGPTGDASGLGWLSHYDEDLDDCE